MGPSGGCFCALAMFFNMRVAFVGEWICTGIGQDFIAGQAITCLGVINKPVVDIENNIAPGRMNNNPLLVLADELPERIQPTPG